MRKIHHRDEEGLPQRAQRSTERRKREVEREKEEELVGRELLNPQRLSLGIIQ
jgi:hypothetical protein